MKSYLCAD